MATKTACNSKKNCTFVLSNIDTNELISTYFHPYL